MSTFEPLLKRQLNLFRVDAGIRKDVLKDLKKLEKLLIGEIGAADITAFKKQRLTEFLSDTRDIIQAQYINISGNLEEQLGQLADIEALGMSKIINKAVGQVVITANGLTAARINSIYSDTLINGAPSLDWWDRQSQNLQNKFTDTIRQGLLLGENNGELIRRVRGTRDVGFTNGIMETSRREAEALVRSSVQAVANAARLEMVSDIEEVDVLRHVSTLDSRTTDICIARDGLEWDAKTLEPIDHNLPFQQPPLHWNCRSLIVFGIAGVPLVGDRASENGPVSADITFGDFLKQQSEEFQNETLGIGKADLWRDGKITLRDLLDQSGNPLTLDELKTKYT